MSAQKRRKKGSGLTHFFRINLSRRVAPFVLFFFTWTCLEPWNLAKAAQDPPKPPAPAAQGARTASEKLAHSVSALKQTFANLDRQITEAQDITPSLGTLSEHRQQVEAANVEIQSMFKDTEAKLQAKGLPAEILQRHQQAVVDYEANFKKLQAGLQAIEQVALELKAEESKGNQGGAKTKRDQLKQQAAAIKAFLKDKDKEPPHKPLDPNNLPYRVSKEKERKPRLKKEEFTELHKPIQLAFAGDLSAPLLAQANTDLPTPEDLTQTVDIQFTQGIRDLATSLGGNPVAIFNWVRQNIMFVPTFGSIQGSEACRLSRECNAHDAASLLIALLRVSGVPARYVVGTVEISPDLFRSAMGDFQDLRAAATLAASGGIPVSIVNAGGNPVAVEMEHVWVEAYVDYVPSRGTVKGAGDTWVPLDAVLKPTHFQAPLDIQTALGINPQTVLDNLIATGTASPDGNSATGISMTEVNNQLTTLTAQFKSFLNTNLPDATVGEVMGVVEIKAKSLSALPASLPGKIVVVGGHFSELPASS